MPIDTDLLAYYRCSDASDEQGTYNATFSLVSVTASGRYGDGWDYTASVDAVATTSGISVDATTTGFSAACWVYNINNGPAAGNATSFVTDDSPGNESMPFYLGFGFSGAFKVFAHAAGGAVYVPAYLISNPAVQLEINGSLAPYLNAWTHICITGTGNTITYYINGVAEATATDANLNRVFNFSRIGNLTSGWFGKTTLGETLDEIAVWSRVLSPAEVSDIYNNEISTLIGGGGGLILPSQGRNTQSGVTQGAVLQGTQGG